MTMNQIPYGSNVRPLHANRDARTYGERTLFQGGERSEPRTPPGTFNGGERKKFVAKGHDAQLQDAQYNKTPAVITTLDGAAIHGTISRRDKWTITVLLSKGTDAGQELIVYKHAIESVLLSKAQPDAQ